MDILELDENLKILAHNGTCFNVEERLKLNMGLQHLLNESKPEDFEELLFWGRISGIAKDYYIAMGVTYTKQYEFPTKTFYFASSADFVFKQFREINTQHKDVYDTITAPFSGDSTLIYGEPVETEENQRDQDTEQNAGEVDPLEDTPPEDLNKGFKPRNLIEEDRLLYTVLAVENDCHIVPHGSFRLTQDHEVERNVSFRGLSHEECFSLNKYSHFRNVQDERKKALLEEDDAIFQPDFLDECHTDKPTGVWSIQKDSNCRTAIIRNNSWAGYTAYHQAGTKL
jgi:radial spoke head protein 9